MNIIAKILDLPRPLFEKGGRLSALHPVYVAVENIFFGPDKVTAGAPFTRDPIDLKRYMTMVILALFPSFLASVYFFGWRILLMLVVSYAAGGAVEVLFAMIRKEEIAEGFLVTGFIFPLILPPSTPLWVVAVGIAFGVLVGKEVFGGTGRNLFNAALVGRTFLAFGYPATMGSCWVPPGHGPWGRLLSSPFTSPVSGVTTATPLALAKGGHLVSVVKLFIGNVGGSAGETSVIAILLGGIFLIVVGVASWRTVLATLISFSVVVLAVHGAKPSACPPLAWSLCAGGILFGTFFMATDPVTSPVTQAGKWFYGLLIGAVTVMIRCFSADVEGVSYAILLGNVFAPLIDEAVLRFRVRRYVHA